MHESLVIKELSNELIFHISRDSTAISARESPIKKEFVDEKPKRKRGRPKKGEIVQPKLFSRCRETPSSRIEERDPTQFTQVNEEGETAKRRRNWVSRQRLFTRLERQGSQTLEQMAEDLKGNANYGSKIDSRKQPYVVWIQVAHGYFRRWNSHFLHCYSSLCA